MRVLALTGILALLLFGCLNNAQTREPAQSSVPNISGSTNGIGDSDLSPMEEGSDEMLPDEDILPPQDTQPKENESLSSGKVDYGGLYDDVSETFSDDEEVPELISEENIVERP